jgi:hypothetical protein
MTPPQSELPYFSFANLKCVLWYQQMLIITLNFYYAWIYKLNLLFTSVLWKLQSHNYFDEHGSGHFVEDWPTASNSATFLASTNNLRKSASTNSFKQITKKNFCSTEKVRVENSSRWQNVVLSNDANSWRIPNVRTALDRQVRRTGMANRKFWREL